MPPMNPPKPCSRPSRHPGPRPNPCSPISIPKFPNGGAVALSMAGGATPVEALGVAEVEDVPNVVEFESAAKTVAVNPANIAADATTNSKVKALVFRSIFLHLLFN
jgi:hypothetical protein